MSKKSNSVKSFQQGGRQWKTREKIEETVQAVLDPESASNAMKKRLVIPASRSERAKFDEIARGMKIDPGTMHHRILSLYCEQKKANATDAQVLIHRIDGLSNEQLKVLELICSREDFTARDILNFVESIKRFGLNRILTLRAFVEMEEVGPGPLHQFFMVSLPQSKPTDVGQEAYEEEVREKMMTPEQVNVFYNICTHIPDMTTRTAIALLPKVRQLKQQHAQIINAFFKESVVFGDKPISNDNIMGLINLWLSLPEIIDIPKFKQLLKRLSKKPEAKKKDFQFITQSFKEETEKESGKSGGKTGFSFSSLFSSKS